MKCRLKCGNFGNPHKNYYCNKCGQPRDDAWAGVLTLLPHTGTDCSEVTQKLVAALKRDCELHKWNVEYYNMYKMLSFIKKDIKEMNLKWLMMAPEDLGNTVTYGELEHFSFSLHMDTKERRFICFYTQ